MSKEKFELVMMFLKALLMFATVFVIPYIQVYLKSNTTKEQRENALFWVKQVTRIAEELYKVKGAGQLKKEYVLEWLNSNRIKLSNEQLSVLIDMVVDEYNKNGWNVLEEKEG